MAEFVSLASISAASVKTYVDIKSTDTDWDALIEAHLLMARSFVEEYCRHDFLSQLRSSEKPLIDRATTEFYLKHYPIASITSLVEDGVTLTEDKDFYVDKDTGRVERIASSDITNPDRCPSYWTTERNAIVATYIGGEAITDDIIAATKEIAAISAGVKKRTYTDNEGVERAASLNSLPKHILEILNRHRHRGRIL